MMNRHSKGSQGPPPQSYHHNGNGNGNENYHGYGPGNGIHGTNPNQYHNGYPAHHPGHDQQFHETPAVSPAPVALQQAQEPLTHFQKCIPRTRTIAHYKRIEQIGEGTYGQVYKATCLSSNRIVALKKIRLTSVATEGLPRTVIREIKILKALQHENMVRMLEVVSSKGCEYLDEEDEHKEDKKRRLLKDEANNTKGEKDSSHKEKKNNNNDTVT
jgi:serine/threonine protein kinase